MHQELTLDIPDPEWMSSNDRSHWRAKARKTAALRHRAGWAAKQLAPTTGPVLVVAHIGYPRAGKADPGNAAPTVKAILDGLTDAGVWPDDDSTHVIGPDYRRDPETHLRGVHRVRLVITPTT